MLAQTKEALGDSLNLHRLWKLALNNIVEISAWNHPNILSKVSILPQTPYLCLKGLFDSQTRRWDQAESLGCKSERRIVV